MLRKFLNNFLNIISLIVFVAIGLFFLSISSIETAQAQYDDEYKRGFSHGNLRVKSHLVFDKKFSGTAKVLDGDSIKVGKREVRLFGLDAPEFKQKCLDKNNLEYACGLASREFLITLIHGKYVECQYAEKDKYDRYLGKCYINQLSINQEIVKNGMAVIYNFTESDETMNKLEAQAKNNKLGIWQGSFELPKEYRKHNPRS